ncbi:hypothetical protein ACQCSX_10925 [Pseudarthrobacter sp. P1]|uniref:hypothetical protein n=1 Tax=Pseudarthrobacter sp. P1 TaxID=3418418 RepID=UPI003CFA45F4
MKKSPIVERTTRGFDRWATGMLAVLAVATWIAMAEVDRLVSDARTPAGLGGPAGALQASDPAAGPALWGHWAELDPGGRGTVASLLTIYAVLDILFPILYIALLWRFFGPRWLPRILLGLLALGEAGEAAAQIWAAAGLREGQLLGAVHVLPVFSEFKWLAAAALVAAVFLTKALRQQLAAALWRGVKAVFFQRLSLAVIVVIAALSLLPLPGVSDQMPDAERAWAGSAAGAIQYGVTTVAVAAVCVGLAALGRRRSELAWDVYATDPPVAKLPASVVWWFYGPAVLLVAVALVVLTGGPLAALEGQFWLFILLPVALLLLSFISWLVPQGPAPVPAAFDPQRAVDIWRCGDVLAMLFAAVGGMALVRTFTAPLALAIAAPGVHVEAGVLAGSVVLFGLGWLTVAAAFPGGAWLVARFWLDPAPGEAIPVASAASPKGLLDPRIKNQSLARKVSWWGLGAGFAVLVLLTFAPVWTTGWAGVPATAIAGVAAWAMVFGFLIVGLQEQRPLPIFARLGLRANPILSVVAVLLAVGSLNGGDGRIHAIRQLPPEVVARDSIQARFDHWLAASAACHRDGPDTGGPGVRPMLLVAAEGGGIRATEWAVQALARMAPDAPQAPETAVQKAARLCGATAVLLSSGVSGGSLGLALTTTSATKARPADAAREAAAQAADPQALAVAVSGAAVGDDLAGGTGLLIPSWTDGVRGWNDRAALMESAWEQAAPQLKDRFDGTVRGPAGALVLNSTAAGLGCRLLISQVEVPSGMVAGPADAAGAAGASGGGCLDGRGFPLSIDLLAHQSATGPQTPYCTLGLRWSTAAMLSSRFPIISPAGRVPTPTAGGCSTVNAYQAIDGGYSEGSALGTLSDLMPAVRAAVQSHNAAVQAAADAGGAAPPAVNDYVVPVVVFLQNSPGADRVAPPPKAAGELAVPLVGINARALQSGAAAWLQRLDDSSDACPTAEPASGCQLASAVVRGTLKGRSAVVVAPASTPALDAPLGWSLSQMSRDRLAAAMAAEAAAGGTVESGPRFGALLALLAGE